MSSGIVNYQTLSADTISKKMFDIVHEVNLVFQLSTPYVRLLLIACKWDKEKLLERLVIIISSVT